MMTSTTALPVLSEPPECDEEAEALRRWGVSRCGRVDREALLAALAGLLVDERPPPREAGALVDHIRRRFHQAQRQVLDDAIALAAAGGRAHRRDDDWPHGLGDDLVGLLEAWEAHQLREEAVVFPAVLEGRGELSIAVDEARRDHAALKTRLDALARRTEGFRPPGHACPAWRVLYLLCARLEAELRAQMALEERSLYGSEPARIRVSTEVKPCA